MDPNQQNNPGFPWQPQQGQPGVPTTTIVTLAPQGLAQAPPAMAPMVPVAAPPGFFNNTWGGGLPMQMLMNQQQMQFEMMRQMWAMQNQQGLVQGQAPGIQQVPGQTQPFQGVQPGQGQLQGYQAPTMPVQGIMGYQVPQIQPFAGGEQMQVGGIPTQGQTQGVAPRVRTPLQITAPLPVQQTTPAPSTTFVRQDQATSPIDMKESPDIIPMEVGGLSNYPHGQAQPRQSQRVVVPPNPQLTEEQRKREEERRADERRREEQREDHRREEQRRRDDENRRARERAWEEEERHRERERRYGAPQCRTCFGYGHTEWNCIERGANQSRIQCYHCHEYGHTRRDCPGFRQQCRDRGGESSSSATGGNREELRVWYPPFNQDRAPGSFLPPFTSTRKRTLSPPQRESKVPYQGTGRGQSLSRSTGQNFAALRGRGAGHNQLSRGKGYQTFGGISPIPRDSRSSSRGSSHHRTLRPGKREREELKRQREEDERVREARRVANAKLAGTCRAQANIQRSRSPSPGAGGAQARAQEPRQEGGAPDVEMRDEEKKDEEEKVKDEPKSKDTTMEMRGIRVEPSYFHTRVDREEILLDKSIRGDKALYRIVYVNAKVAIGAVYPRHTAREQWPLFVQFAHEQMPEDQVDFHFGDIFEVYKVQKVLDKTGKALKPQLPKDNPVEMVTKVGKKQDWNKLLPAHAASDYLQIEKGDIPESSWNNLAIVMSSKIVGRDVNKLRWDTIILRPQFDGLELTWNHQLKTTTEIQNADHLVNKFIRADYVLLDHTKYGKLVDFLVEVDEFPEVDYLKENVNKTLILKDLSKELFQFLNSSATSCKIPVKNPTDWHIYIHVIAMAALMVQKFCEFHDLAPLQRTQIRIARREAGTDTSWITLNQQDVMWVEHQTLGRKFRRDRYVKIQQKLKNGEIQVLFEARIMAVELGEDSKPRRIRVRITRQGQIEMNASEKDFWMKVDPNNDKLFVTPMDKTGREAFRDIWQDIHMYGVTPTIHESRDVVLRVLTGTRVILSTVWEHFVDPDVKSLTRALRIVKELCQLRIAEKERCQRDKTYEERDKLGIAKEFRGREKFRPNVATESLQMDICNMRVKMRDLYFDSYHPDKRIGKEITFRRCLLGTIDRRLKRFERLWEVHFREREYAFLGKLERENKKLFLQDSEWRKTSSEHYAVTKSVPKCSEDVLKKLMEEFDKLEYTAPGRSQKRTVKVTSEDVESDMDDLEPRIRVRERTPEETSLEKTGKNFRRMFDDQTGDTAIPVPSTSQDSEVDRLTTFMSELGGLDMEGTTRLGAKNPQQENQDSNDPVSEEDTTNFENQTMLDESTSVPTEAGPRTPPPESPRSEVDMLSGRPKKQRPVNVFFMDQHSVNVRFDLGIPSEDEFSQFMWDKVQQIQKAKPLLLQDKQIWCRIVLDKIPVIAVSGPPASGKTHLLTEVAKGITSNALGWNLRDGKVVITAESNFSVSRIVEELWDQMEPRDQEMEGGVGIEEKVLWLQSITLRTSAVKQNLGNAKWNAWDFPSHLKRIASKSEELGITVTDQSQIERLEKAIRANRYKEEDYTHALWYILKYNKNLLTVVSNNAMLAKENQLHDWPDRWLIDDANVMYHLDAVAIIASMRKIRQIVAFGCLTTLQPHINARLKTDTHLLFNGLYTESLLSYIENYHPNLVMQTMNCNRRAHLDIVNILQEAQPDKVGRCIPTTKDYGSIGTLPRAIKGYPILLLSESHIYEAQEGQIVEGPQIANQNEVVKAILDFVIMDSRNLDVIVYCTSLNESMRMVSWLEANGPTQERMQRLKSFAVRSITASQGEEADLIILVMGGQTFEENGSSSLRNDRLVLNCLTRARQMITIIGHLKPFDNSKSDNLLLSKFIRKANVNTPILDMTKYRDLLVEKSSNATAVDYMENTRVLLNSQGMTLLYSPRYKVNDGLNWHRADWRSWIVKQEEAEPARL